MKQRSLKQDWLRANLGKSPVDALFVHRFAKNFSMRSEMRAAEEIKTLMATERAVNAQVEDFAKESLMAMGFDLLAEMRAANAFGPAGALLAQLWKMNALDAPQQVQVGLSLNASPEMTATIRARLAKLMADQAVREKARMIDVDLDALASGNPNAITPDSAAWGWRQAQREQALLDAPMPEPDPATTERSESDDSEPDRSHERAELARAENPLASHRATARELGPK